MATYTLPIYNNGLLLMAKKLTDKGIERIKPPVGKAQEEHWDTEVSGLGLRVGAKGTKAFTLLIKTYVMGKKKNIRATWLIKVQSENCCWGPNRILLFMLQL